MANSQAEKYKRLAKEARQRARRLQKENDRLSDENKSLSDWQKDASETLEEMASAGRGSVLKDAYLKAGADPDLVDDLITLAPLPDEVDEADAKAVGKHVRAALVKRPRFAKPEEEEAEDADGDDEPGDEQADDDLGGDEEPAALALAPRKPAAGKAPAKPEGKPAAGKPAEGNGKPAAPLSRSEGAGKGARHDHRTASISETVSKDFQATGRSDDFRI